MNTELPTIPVWMWILFSVILIVQGTWVFNDASKRGMNRWLWGLFALLNTPTHLIVYLIVSRSILGMKTCTKCKKRYNQKYHFCPHCGAKNK